MASTGTQITYNGNFYLKIRWDITSQNIATNRSGVRVRMYLGANSGWSLSDSSNSWALSIDGVNFSGSDVPVNINGSERLIADEQVFVDHNSNGTKSVWINGSVAGFYFGGINPSGFSAILDTIPRASSSSSSASWTATEELGIGIQRADSSFTHTIRVYVNNVLVASASDINTSWTFNLSSFHSNVVKNLGSASSVASRYEIDTYSGSTKIGSTFSRSGTVTAPASSTLSSVSSSFNVGDTLNYNINRANSSFSHKVELFYGATAVVTSTPGTGSTSVSLPTTDLYNRITTSNSGNVVLRITTYYTNTQNTDTQIRTPVNYNLTARITNSNPNPPSSISYSISGYTGVTGNTANAIVQGKTNVTVTFSGGSAINGATLVGYSIKANGMQDKPVTSAGTHPLGVLNSSGNGSIIVEAIDSRGNTASASVPITIIPYQRPVQSSSVRRDDGFSSSVTLTVRGIMSDVKIGGTRKNYIKSIQYRIKTSPAISFPSTYETINVGTNGSNVTYDDANGFTITRALTLSELQSHEIEVVVTDAFDGVSNTSETRNLILSTGQPLLWLDTDKLSVGVGVFPVGRDELRVKGYVHGGALSTTGHTLDSSGLSGGGTSFIKKSGNQLVLNDGGFNTSGIKLVGDVLGTGKLSANLTHSGDYFNIRSYSPTYGAGQAEIWYSDTDNRLRIGSRSDSNGTIRNTQLSVNDIEVSNITTPSGVSSLSLPTTTISTLDVTTSYTGGGSVTLTGTTASFKGYAFIASGTNGLLRVDGEMRVVTPDSSGTYRPLRASSFPTGSSISYKTNLERVDERVDALTLISETDVWHYHLKSNVDNFIFDKPKIGVIAEMVNPLIRDEDGVDPYSMVAVAWRAIQQLSEKVKEQEKELDDLKLALGVTE